MKNLIYTVLLTVATLCLSACPPGTESKNSSSENANNNSNGNDAKQVGTQVPRPCPAIDWDKTYAIRVELEHKVKDLFDSQLDKTDGFSFLVCKDIVRSEEATTKITRLYIWGRVKFHKGKKGFNDLFHNALEKAQTKEDFPTQEVGQIWYVKPDFSSAVRLVPDVHREWASKAFLSNSCEDGTDFCWSSCQPGYEPCNGACAQIPCNRPKRSPDPSAPQEPKPPKP